MTLEYIRLEDELILLEGAVSFFFLRERFDRFIQSVFFRPQMTLLSEKPVTLLIPTLSNLTLQSLNPFNKTTKTRRTFEAHINK